MTGHHLSRNLRGGSRLAVAAVLLAAPACSRARTPPRILAVGDLHADLAQAMATLQMAGIVDADGRWAAGDTIFVQTGDITDRGPDSKELIELLDRLEEEAEAAGGRVVALLGNHESMNLLGDWRYVSAGDVADFGSVEARRTALSPEGALGAWLRERDAVAVVGDTVFTHGGITPAFARRGFGALNDEVRAALANAPVRGAGGVTEDRAEADVLGGDGPLWYRGYLTEDEGAACATLGEALKALGARRMVVGHTTQQDGRIAVRCEGRLLGIDTGISSHYGAHSAALRIEAGDAWALYPDGAVDLADPAEGAP